MPVILPSDLAVEFERRYFWWQPVGAQERPVARILAQAMELGSFEDVRRIERAVEPQQLVDFMLHAEPGWFSEKSWEFWRGRLSAATGRLIPDHPPRRSLHAATL